jgi:hypothetical protein
MGVRSNRFAMIIDDLKVTYLGVCVLYFFLWFPLRIVLLMLCKQTNKQIEKEAGVSVSGVDAVLAHL